MTPPKVQPPGQENQYPGFNDAAGLFSCLYPPGWLDSVLFTLFPLLFGLVISATNYDGLICLN